MYKLYYVRGISESDTPYFKTLTEQATFFESKKIVEIDAIYPPHYKNIIELTKEDLTFNTQINYVGIEFNDKMYYYFIDDISYVNEDLCRISITMDVIQTYMFDIDFIHSDIDRKLIDRYNDDNTINRNYLRENRSEGTFIDIEEKLIKRESDLDVGYIVIKYIPSLKAVNPIANLVYARKNYDAKFKCKGFNDISLPTGYAYAIIPCSLDPKYSVRVRGKACVFDQSNGELANTAKDIPLTITEDSDTEHLNETLNVISTYSNVLGIFYVPFNFLSKYVNIIQDSPTEDTRYFEIKEPYTKNFIVNYCSEKDATFHFVYTTLAGEFEIDNFIHLYSFDISLNRAKDNPFTYKYVPQLLDENYIKLEFGEKNQLFQMPLYQLNEPMCNLHYGNIYLNNIRYYYMTNLDANNDLLKTFQVCNSNESFDLFNNPWKEYLANNSATETRGKALSVVSKYLTADASLAVGAVTGNPFAIMRGISSLAQLPLQIAQYGVHRDNLQLAPNTEKLSNNPYADYGYQTVMPLYHLSQVNDIDKVAEVYEEYGYKVNEHTNENLFEYCNTRYYYNLIKCRDLEISLKVLTDMSTINRIKERFINGVRMWNTNTTLGIGELFVYDNVEKKYITE